MANLIRTNLMVNNMDAYSQAVSGFDIKPRVLGTDPVATDVGFNHLSRFSQYYRARFGERPSQSLAKA